MESTSLEVQNHSAMVRMELHVDGTVLRISQLGPDFLILREPVDRPPAQAELFISIDGKERRRAVFLPAGLSATSPRTSIVPVGQTV
jgi:hypothetical protein